MSSYLKPQKNMICKDEQILQDSLKMPKNKRMYLSASATIEASIVIPLFIYAVMTIMYLIQIIGVQVKVQEILYNESRKIAKYMYVYEKLNNNKIDSEKKDEMLKAATKESDNNKYSSILHKGIEIGLVESLFLSELGTENSIESHIIGGLAGFNFMDSNIMSGNHMVNIVVKYRIKNPFDIFGFGITTITQSVATNAWVGEQTEGQDSSNSSTTQDTMVYITSNGSVYHTKRNCTYLILSIHEIDVDDLEECRNESGGKYYACEKCGDKESNGKLYITEYGDRFHTTKNCSSIMRNIMEVKLSQVQDKEQCIKCKGD